MAIISGCQARAKARRPGEGSVQDYYFRDAPSDALYLAGDRFNPFTITMRFNTAALCRC